MISWHWIERPVLGLRKGILAKTTETAEASGRLFGPHSIWLVSLAVYGLFVVYFSGVFPLREIGHNVLHGSVGAPVLSEQPRGL